MKTNATEFFTGISPVKGEIGTMNGTHMTNGRSGRCHCCPYGYHIDLDFVRYCEMVNQVSKNDNPTLRQLKKLKRARRRQTQSMEVLLGLEPGTENTDKVTHLLSTAAGATTAAATTTIATTTTASVNHHNHHHHQFSNNLSSSQQFPRLQIIEEPSKTDTSSPSLITTTKGRERTPPPPPPPRRCRLPGGSGGAGGPPPDVINTSRGTVKGGRVEGMGRPSPSSSALNATDALQEAVLDFEEMLETSRERISPGRGGGGGKEGRSNTLPSLDLLHHTPQPTIRPQHLEVKNVASVSRSHSLPRQSGEDWAAVSRLRTSSTSSLPPPPDVGHIQQGGNGRLADTLAALNAARGCFTPVSQDFDSASVASGVSGVSTTTLQSIRDQMAASLARLKELEEEVRQIPMLQVKVNVLKEEKKLLLEQVRGLARGEDRPPLLLPPSFDVDLTDLSEDELESRLVSLRSAPPRRRRSESPLRVNLEEFRSYRKARRGSLSEGSEAESLAGEEVPLRITEPHDPQRRLTPSRRLGKEAPYSLPGTPLLERKKSRDATTSCRVLTRDVGITHVGARTRSVGLMTSSEMAKCTDCEERNHRTFQHKGVATMPPEDGRRRLSVKSVSSESIGPEEAEQEGTSSKNSFLAKLGRKSAIISRLSEPQLVPPTLTFDNSTNTESIKQQDQASGPGPAAGPLYTTSDLSRQLAAAREEWQAAEHTRNQLARAALPLTLNRGVQASLDEPTPTRTIFRPLQQSVAIQAQPRVVDTGVGASRVTQEACPRCSGIRTRSVASGTSVATPPPTPPPRTRSVASGELGIHDPCCPARPAPPCRSVGCSLDRLTDRLCERCDNLRVRSVGVGTPPSPPTPAPPPPVEKPQAKSPPTHSTHTQTRSPSTRTASVNTMSPLPLRKEEMAPPSPAGTPEVERRAFGSSGVRVCDKCHEAITSVAKDIVGTSGTNSATSLPPLPPLVSKIPRLVDITKVEPRIDPPLQRPDSRNTEGLTPPRPLKTEPPSIHVQVTAPRSATPSPSKISTPSPSKASTPSPSKTTTTTSTTTTTITTEATKSTTPKASPSRGLQTAPQPTIKDTPTSQDFFTQGKRVAYNRQDTYTKSSEGIDNLGFEDHKPSPQKPAAATPGSASILATITEATRSTTTTPTSTTATSSITTTTTTSSTTSKTQKQRTETKDTTSRKTSSEGEGDVEGAVITGRGRTVSVSGSEDESLSEDEGDSVVGGASLLSQLGGVSSCQSDASIFTTTTEATRKKAVPSREMKAALKVLNDSIGKPVRSGQQLTNALNIVQREWLKVSGQKDADPHAVEDYMDVFEDFSKNLLQRVVNLADVNGNTAMHYAVSHGNFDVVSVLLDSKVCNVNQQNKAGYTATMLVSLAQIRSQTHASVVQRLFQMGDLNIKASQHGQTALMLAVSHGRLDMVQMLVAAGAEINIQDDDGSTALMCAAEHGHLAIVKFLLAHPDTDPTLTDNDGSTALTIAVEAGHRDVGVLLYKYLNLSRGSSPYSSVRIKRSRTSTALRSSITPPPRSSAPSSPGRSRKSSNPASPGRSRKSSASLSNLIL